MIKPILSMRRFWMWLAIIATVLALLLWWGSRGGVHLMAPVTRIDNLEVANYLQLTSSSGPTVKTATSDPNGAITEPRGSLRLRTDAANANIYQNTNASTAWSKILNDTNHPTVSCGTNTVVTSVAATGQASCAAPPAFSSSAAGYATASGGGTTNYLRADGTWAVPPGSGVTPSVSIADSAFSGTITLNSTDGTATDWWVNDSNASFSCTNPPPRILPFTQSYHSWRLGTKEIVLGLDWIVLGTNGLSPTTFGAQVIQGTQASFTSLSTISTNLARGCAGGDASNFGFSVGPIGSGVATRKLNIYTALFSGDITVTAKLGTGETASTVIATGVGGTMERKIVVTFLGGGSMTVQVMLTTQRNTGGAIGVYGMSLTN